MTQINWSARILNQDSKPMSGINVELQLFDMPGSWRTISAGASDNDGHIRITADDGLGQASVATMLRLVDAATKAQLGGVPVVQASEAPPQLNVHFGDIVLLPQDDRFSVLRVGVAGRFGAQAEVAGVPGAFFTRAGAVSAQDNSDLAAVRAQLVERDVKIARLQATREDIGNRLAEAQAENIRIREMADTTAAAQLDTREAVALKVQLADREATVAELRSTIDGFATKLAASEADVVKFRAQADPIAARPGATTASPAGDGGVAIGVGDFATRIGGEMDNAQVALKARGFSLGKISIAAKAVVQDGGNRVQFLNDEIIKNIKPETISTINLDYLPDTTAAPEDFRVPVPDIRALTESAARRVLASIGLVLDVAQGPLAAPFAAGQAMMQTPLPTTDTKASVPRGSHVLAVFATKPPS